MFKKIVRLSALLLLLCTVLVSCSFPPINILGNKDTPKSLFETVASMLEKYSYYDIDSEKIAKMVVEDYRELTGDKYAFYYTAEEYAELKKENNGESQGIGISVIENIDEKCIEIINVMPDSPALAAGLVPGDLIVTIGKGESAEQVSEIGYESALKKMQGRKDTPCEFSIIRNGDRENPIEFSIVRAPIQTQAVYYTVSSADATVGIVKIEEFILTTPTQFKAAMEALIDKGCTKFVYDMRNNPGGDLKSVSAVLSYFLNNDDVIIRVRGRGQSEEEMVISKCKEVNYSGDYAGCSVSANEIGMYRKYPAAILTNGWTASAAELFTSTFRDYNLATVIGEKTYGKGCMQSIYDMSYFGDFTGGLKLTTEYYYPPKSDNYHDIGIYPDSGYEIPLSEEAKKINLFKRINEFQSKDNQLTAAVDYLENK